MKQSLIILVSTLAASTASAGRASFQGDAPTVGWVSTGYFSFMGDAPYFANVRSGAMIPIDSFPKELGGPPGASTDLKPSRTSPDGKAKAVIKVQVQTGDGVWKGGDFTPPGKQLTTLLQVEREGKVSTSATWTGVLAADVYWSPDSKYVLWLLRTSESVAPGAPVSYTVIVGSGGGPRTQLLAAADILSRVSPKATEAAEGAGLTVVFIGKAKKPRDTTIVYAAKGFEEVASRAAAAMPGGATVEALNWEVAADVVVAVGKSALGGAK